MKCFLPDLSAFSQTSAEWQADTCKFVQYLLIQGFKSPRAFFYSGKKTSCIFPLLSFSLLYCQITLLPISCPLPSPPCAAVSCRASEIPPCVFAAPPGYTMLGGKQRDSMREEEEDLLQFAIQQSLLEAGSEYDQVASMWNSCEIIFSLLRGA